MGNAFFLIELILLILKYNYMSIIKSIDHLDKFKKSSQVQKFHKPSRTGTWHRSWNVVVWKAEKENWQVEGMTVKRVESEEDHKGVWSDYEKKMC